MADLSQRFDAGTDGPVDGHGGEHAVAMAAAHGVDTLFTLSGAHVFPMYDGAVNADPPMRLVDVRHEQTAVFAAEALGKLTRVPGLAVLTAGPGVTNGAHGYVDYGISRENHCQMSPDTPPRSC